jgi:TonB family protein
MKAPVALILFLAAGNMSARTALPSITCQQNNVVGIQPFLFPSDADFKKIFEGNTPPITLAIKVDPAGNFTDIKVESSSLDRALDRSAMHTVRHSHLSGACLTDADGTLYIRYKFENSSRPVSPYIWRQTTWHQAKPIPIKN